MNWPALFYSTPLAPKRAPLADPDSEEPVRAFRRDNEPRVTERVILTDTLPQPEAREEVQKSPYHVSTWRDFFLPFLLAAVLFVSSGLFSYIAGYDQGWHHREFFPGITVHD